ncbi:MAG: DUF805 domain-containing protein [Bacteroidota bacterium]
MNWYLKVLNNYAKFKGRARRQEYWIFVLFNMIFAFVTIILDHLFGLIFDGLDWGYLCIIYVLIVLLPGLAVSVRRLHDIGKSGWFLLLALLPLIGSVWLLALLTTEGNIGDNRYGECPKETQTDYSEISRSYRDFLIFFAVIWICFNNLFWIVLPTFGLDFYSTSVFKILNYTTSLVWVVIPISLAFTIKSKPKQTAAFVLSGLYVLSQGSSILIRIIQDG